MGTSKVLSNDNAEKLSSDYYQLEQIKSNYQNGAYNDMILLINSIKNIAIDMSTITGKNATSIYNAIGNYLQEP